MKTFLKVGFFVVLSVFATAFTVTAQSIKVGEVNTTGQPVVTLSSSSIITAVQNTFANGASFSSVSIDHPSGGTPYLILIGTKSGNSFNTAIQLTKNGNDYDLAAMTATHTCTGHNCSACRFVRNESNKIDGCDCEMSNGGQIGGCDHTISDSDDNFRISTGIYDELSAN